jgi:hypothetical protein
MMAFDQKALEVIAERVFVVEDPRSGRVVHIHRVLTHRGAKSMTDDEAKKRALDFAAKIGHDTKSLSVRRSTDANPTSAR